MLEAETRIAEILINEYLEQYLFEPQISWPKCEFDVRSYSRWAAKEILRRLKERPETGVINIIQGFMDELDYYTDLSEHWTSAKIFRIARETSEDLLKLFL